MRERPMPQYRRRPCLQRESRIVVDRVVIDRRVTNLAIPKTDRPLIRRAGGLFRDVLDLGPEPNPSEGFSEELGFATPGLPSNGSKCDQLFVVERNLENCHLRILRAAADPVK